MTFSRRGLLSRLTRTVLALAAVGALGVASAQTPKTIKLMVGFPPGGGTDAIARILAERLKDEMGVPVLEDFAERSLEFGLRLAQPLASASEKRSMLALGVPAGAKNP